jgi:hypothetical protein
VNTNDASADLDRIDDFAKITPLAMSYLSRYRGVIRAWSPGREVSPHDRLLPEGSA